MTQLVFIPGAGAGGSPEAYTYQLRHFPGSVAPTLPGHPDGKPCPDVKSCTEWVRGWLWAQGMNKDLVLVGYTLGACIALQYALDYPEEVKGVVVMTVAIGPKSHRAGPGTYDLHLRAAKDPQALEEWLAARRRVMALVEPGLRERLVESHRRNGSLSQMHDTKSIDGFDVRDRIGGLKPKLLIMRGLDDPSKPPEYEKELHDAVPGSTYLKLSGAGHFPVLEIPAEFNRLVEEFVAGL